MVPRLLAMAARTDDDSDLFGCSQFSQQVGTVAFIGNEGVKVEWCEQRLSTEKVMAFTAIQDDLKGEAKRINAEMDLAAEATPALTWAPFVLAPLILEPPAAHTWARTAVLPGMTAAMSGSWANSLNTSVQTPFSSQRA